MSEEEKSESIACRSSGCSQQDQSTPLRGVVAGAGRNAGEFFRADEWLDGREPPPAGIADSADLAIDKPYIHAGNVSAWRVLELSTNYAEKLGAVLGAQAKAAQSIVDSADLVNKAEKAVVEFEALYGAVVWPEPLSVSPHHSGPLVPRASVVDTPEKSDRPLLAHVHMGKSPDGRECIKSVSYSRKTQSHQARPSNPHQSSLGADKDRCPLQSPQPSEGLAIAEIETRQQQASRNENSQP